MKPIRYGILLVLCLLLPMVALAQDRAEQSQEKRRIVYVPQDQLDVLVEKHGQGVLLDVEEYLTLWSMAEQRGLPTGKPPVVGEVLLGGSVTGAVSGERVTLTVTYQARLLKPGIQRVNFPVDKAAVGVALADGKPALLSRDRSGTYLLLQGEGDHEIEVTFTGKMQRKEELHTFSCRLPTGSGLSVDLTIPPGMEPHPGSFGRLYQATDSAAGTLLRAHVPAYGQFHFAFRPAREEGARSALVHSRGRTLSRVGPRLLTTVSALEVFVVRRPVDELILEVPANMQVTEVAAPDLVGFAPAEDGSVRLAFKQPVTGRIPVVLKMERSLAGPGELVLPEVLVRSAVDERGYTAVEFTSGIEGRVITAEAVAREPIAPAAQSDAGQQGQSQNRAPAPDELFLGGAAALYRYWSKDRSLTVRTSQPERRITADVTQILTLGNAIREIKVSFTYESEGGRIYQLTPSLPPAWELAGVKVDAPAASRHERRPDGTLVVDFPSGVAAGTPVRITAHLLNFDPDWRDATWTERTMALPVARVGAGVEVRGGLVIFASEEYEIRDRELTGLNSEPVEMFGQAGARLGYRWREAGASGTLSVARRTPKVSVRYLGFAAPGEKTVRYTGYLHYTIQRAGILSFRFIVSGGYGDRLHVTAPMNAEPVRRRLENGDDLFEITLPTRLKGEVIVGLTLEEELGADGFTFPSVRVQDVEDETGYLAVQSGDNMEVTVKTEGLRDIGLEEMGPLMATVGYRPSRGLLAAFQYSVHPVSLTLKTERFQDTKVLTAFVQKAHLLSLVARDGSIRTRATYRILNADRQFLSVKLPTGARLWGALVGGKAVKPSRGKGVDLIPLVTTTGNTAVMVVLIYESQRDELDSSGELNLVAPVLVGATGSEADWDVWLPSGYRVTDAGGVFGARLPALPEPWLFRAFDDFLDGMAGGGGFGAEMLDSAAPVQSMVNEGSEYYPGDNDRGVAATRVAPPRPAAKPGGSSPDPARGPMRQSEQVLEDPVIKDAKISDHNETDNDMPMEESLGEDDFISDAPFDGPSTNAAIGVGGGAGGRFGGRGGRRQVQARLGRAGGLSLDVPIVAGGTHQAVSALGISGDVRLTYVEAPARTARGYVVSVVAALIALFVTGMLKRDSRYVAPLVWVVVVAAFATFAPSWFGARDLTMWDAIARGTVWAGGIMILIGIARKFSTWAKPVATAAVLLVAVALFASSAEARGKPKPKVPAAPAGETVYVPYDPAHPDQLNGLGKVFVPFSRFQELWNAAHPDQPLQEPMKAPVPWLVTGASYQGTVDGETAAIAARFDLIVLSKDWVEVALPLSPAVVEEALVDGEPVRVLSRKGAHVLIIKGEGARRVTLKLRALLAQNGDRRSLAMAIPAIPRSVLGFELPFHNADVTLTGPSAPRIDGTRLSAMLGPVGKIGLTFRPKTKAPRIESRVEVESREMLNVRDGLVQFRLQSEFRVVTGSLTEVQFQADPAYEIVEIIGNEVKSWSLTDDRITVLLGKKIDKSTVVTVVAELPDGVRARAVTVPAFAPLGAVFERGVLGVAAAPDLRVTLSDQQNLDRIAGAVPGLTNLIAGPSALHSAWRFVLRPLGLTVATEPFQAEIRVQIPVQHLVDREWLVSRATFKFDVRGDGTFEFPVTIPADVQIDSVKGSGLERWWRDGETMTFSTRSPVRGTFEVHVAFRRPLDPTAPRIDLPEVHAANVSRERGWILVAHAPGLSLTLLDDSGLVKEAISQYAKREKLSRVQTNVYGYRQEGEPYTLAVARTFPEARVTPFSTSRLQVENDRVVVDTNFVFVIENAGEDTFRVFLPEGEGDEPILEAAKTRTVVWEDFELDGRKGKMLTVVLQQDAVGAYQMRLVYEKRLAAVTGREREWETLVHAPEPQGENASCYAFALNLSSGEVTFGKPDGLTDADPLTFPQLPNEQVLPRHLILRGWHGRGAGFSLPVNLRIHSFADFPDALISSADLLCTVGRDGWTRNRMIYTVLNRTRQFLELSMPKGAELEAVRVGGRAVKPGRRRAGGGERIVIPLSRMQVGDISTAVEIYWTRPLGNPDRPVDLSQIGELEILEPRIYGLEVEQTFHTINLPEGYRVSFDGNMQRIGEAKRLLWQYEKAVEEQVRVVQVQSKGNVAQQARADESGLRNRANIEYLEQTIANLDLTREDVEKLQTSLRKKQAVDETFADNFRGRAGNLRMQDKEDSRALKQEDLAKAAFETKKLAEDRVQQEYRYKGKSNVVSQKWETNPTAGPQTNAAITRQVRLEGHTAGGEQSFQLWRTSIEMTMNESLNKNSVLYFDLDNITNGLDDGQVVQIVDGTIQFGDGVQGNRVPAQTGAAVYRQGAGGGGGGYRGPQGEASPGQRDAGAPRPPAERRAGLLSLPVTVPTRGRTFRFEKLNGGAKLLISVDGRDSGPRGWGPFGWFVLVIAALGALYRFRPDRRIPFFRPAALFLAGLLLFFQAFPLSLLALMVAVTWAALEGGRRIRAAKA